MSDSVHVDAPNEQCSIAMIDESIKQASALKTEAISAQAGAEELGARAQGLAADESRKQMGAEGEMVAELGASSTGIAGLDVGLNLLQTVSEARSDPAQSREAGEMVASGLATEVGSIESTQSVAVTRIETSFEGPSFMEQFNGAGASLDAFNTETSGMAAAEDKTAEMKSVSECKMAMGMANEQVLAAGMRLKASAPAMAGPGGASQSIQQLQAQHQQIQLAQMPGMDMMMKPKGPTDAMLSDVKEDEGMMA